MAQDLPAAGDLVGEPLEPEPGRFDAAGAARGEPGLPLRFGWRGRAWAVAAVERSWKTLGRDHGGSREQYVRRHWATVRTEDGTRLRIYGERGGRRQRWWVHRVEAPAADPPR